MQNLFKKFAPLLKSLFWQSHLTQSREEPAFPSFYLILIVFLFKHITYRICKHYIERKQILTKVLYEMIKWKSSLHSNSYKIVLMFNFNFQLSMEHLLNRAIAFAVFYKMISCYHSQTLCPYHGLSIFLMLFCFISKWGLQLLLGNNNSEHSLLNLVSGFA